MKVRYILIGLYLVLVLGAISLIFLDSRDAFCGLGSIMITLPWSLLLVEWSLRSGWDRCAGCRYELCLSLVFLRALWGNF